MLVQAFGNRFLLRTNSEVLLSPQNQRHQVLSVNHSTVDIHRYVGSCYEGDVSEQLSDSLIVEPTWGRTVSILSASSRSASFVRILRIIVDQQTMWNMPIAHPVAEGSDLFESILYFGRDVRQ